jgi:hypothetical protein
MGLFGNNPSSRGRRSRRGSRRGSRRSNFMNNTDYHDMMFIDVPAKGYKTTNAFTKSITPKSLDKDGFPIATATATITKATQTNTKSKKELKGKEKVKQQQQQHKSRRQFISPRNMTKSNKIDLLSAKISSSRHGSRDFLKEANTSETAKMLGLSSSSASSSYDRNSRRGGRRSRSLDPKLTRLLESSGTDSSGTEDDHEADARRQAAARPRSTRSSKTRQSSSTARRRGRSRSGERSRSVDGGKTRSNSNSNSSISNRKGDRNKDKEKADEEARPVRRMKLGLDMTVLADGINLDEHSRMMLAVHDARTLDDFYLMADTDFRDLIIRANLSNHTLHKLQVRKIRMLRRWLKEVIEENMENGSDSCFAGQRKQRGLVPTNWKEQFKNDLPNIKLQLRQQGDSLCERSPLLNYIASFIGCGVGM